MPEPLDRVLVTIPGQVPVEISWDEREELLERLRVLDSDEKVVRRFEAVGASRPVELDDDDDRGRLRTALELWQATAIDDFPDAIAELLAALQGADQ